MRVLPVPVVSGWALCLLLAGAAAAQPPQDRPNSTTASGERVALLGARVQAYIDSLQSTGVEEIYTRGRGGNAPSDAIERMNRVLDGTYRNPEALRVSQHARDWGQALREAFHDLGAPLVTRIDIHADRHLARWYHRDQLLHETPVALGDPEIGKATPEGSFHVVYIDWRPISRWRRGNVPYGHEYNPYGSRQIPFYRDWTLHGNNAPEALGRNISKGCVRMHNADVLVLAELVEPIKTKVNVLP